MLRRSTWLLTARPLVHQPSRSATSASTSSNILTLSSSLSSSASQKNETVSPQAPARAGRKLRRGHRRHQSSSSSSSSDNAGARSLRAQGIADRATDLTMVGSSKAYKQREQSGAPQLVIPSGAKNDLPQFSGRNRTASGRRPSQTSRDIVRGARLLHDEAESDSGPSFSNDDIEEVLHANPNTFEPAEEPTGSEHEYSRISARDVQIQEVIPLRSMRIAKLRSSLGRVLFSSGVHPLRDPRSGVWNFDTTLQNIPSPDQFAFHRCPQYITPSEDEELLDLAERNDCKFLGSTSTLTKALSQIYFAISGGKGVDLSSLSQHFVAERTNFTPGAELPASIILNQLPHGRFSVDSDKRWDIENVISDYGRILEKMLTCEEPDFNRFLTSSPESAVPDEERTEREAYKYQRIVMTRDCLEQESLTSKPEHVFRSATIANSAYDISKEKGFTQSYEREYYDLLRAGMLKFSLQVRIGGMDGIFLAYHNTSRLFGFQYVSLSEMDERVFGSTELADQAFKLSVSLLEDMLARCIAVFPDQAVNVTIKHTPAKQLHSVTAYVEPKEWYTPDVKRPVKAITFNMQNSLDNETVEGPIAFSVNEEIRQAQNWSIRYTVSETSMNEDGQKEARRGLQSLHQDLIAMTSLYVPAGQSVQSMSKRDQTARRKERKARRDQEAQADVVPTPSVVSDERLEPVHGSSPIEAEPFLKVRWKEPGPRQLKLREEAAESGRAYEKRKGTWKSGIYAWTL